MLLSHLLSQFPFYNHLSLQYKIRVRSSGIFQEAEKQQMLCSEEDWLWQASLSLSACVCVLCLPRQYHKLGDLKQQKLILSQFWRPEVQNEGASWVTLPVEFLGGDPCHFQHLGASRHPLAQSCITSVFASVFRGPSVLLPVYLSPSECLLWGHMRLDWRASSIIQDDFVFEIFNLITSANKVTFTGFAY